MFSILLFKCGVPNVIVGCLLNSGDIDPIDRQSNLAHCAVIIGADYDLNFSTYGESCRRAHNRTCRWSDVILNTIIYKNTYGSNGGRIIIDISNIRMQRIVVTALHKVCIPGKDIRRLLYVTLQNIINKIAYILYTVIISGDHFNVDHIANILSCKWA